MNNFIKIKSMRHDERQLLYVKFNPLFEEIERLFQNSRGEAHVAYGRVLDIISDMADTVKGEPEKQGHWIPSENKTFKCSECGYGFEHEGYIHFFNFCPECGGEVDIREMDFADNDGFALASFECKKCHKCINVTAEYKNNPRTAVSLAWNEYVVRREAHKAMKYASEEMTRKGVPVDCVKCRFYNRHDEFCRKHNEKTLPFCFCYDGEEREYHVKVTTDNPNLSDVISEMISDMPEYVQQRYAEYWHNKIFSDRKEQGDDGQGQAD